MPLLRCRKGNQPGYKWGPQGTCYTYNPANPASKRQARRRANKQGRAIEASKRRNES